MNKRIGSLLMMLGLILLVLAAGIAGYNIWDSNRAADTSESIAQQLVARIPEHSTVSENAESIAHEVPEKTMEEQGSVILTEKELPDYLLVPEMKMPEEVVDGIAYIGVLEIPDLALTLPVASDWSYPLLKKTPCRYAGSAYTNDLVIAAHNYDRHFGNLGKLFLDSEILFTDIRGNLFRYKVVEFEALAPTAITEMTSDQRGLTLFTCTVGGKSRITLRAELVEAE